ncbi:tail fiber assembly protein, partial [Escherichia coli]
QIKYSPGNPGRFNRVLLNRVDTSTAPDIEWPANPVRE